MDEQPRADDPDFDAGEPEPHRPDALARSLLRAAAALRDAEVPFMLCGSMACWARGGPEPFTKDIDLCIKRDDADRALGALDACGMATSRPPHGWLYKAWDDGILIDLLFAPANVPVTDEALHHGDEMLVMSVPMNVAAIDDVMATKLLALGEDSIDLKQLLQIARALREQISWAPLFERTRSSPYAMAFFTLVEQLRIIEADALAGAENLSPDQLPAPHPHD